MKKTTNYILASSLAAILTITLFGVLASLTELKIHLILTLSGMVIVLTIFMLLLGRAMKRAEEAYENQIKFQQTLINTMPSPVFYKDAACRYLGCNKAFEAFVGHSQAELVGKTPHEIWPMELADIYRQQDLALLENPGLQVYESAVRYSDGTLREVIFYKATFEGNNGMVAGLVGVILDITERKAAEDATKNAYQQLAEIVEFLPDATFVVDKEKRVIAWNRAIEIMTGLEKHEVLGQGDYAYAIPFYGKRRPILIDLLGEEQNVINQNYKWIKKEGRTLFTEALVPSFRNGDCRYFWATATPLFDKQGNQVGAIESIRDITEYRRAEQEKSRLEAQLQQARMMESLLVRLGHDLKTPLTPLFILLPMIRERVADSSLEKMLDICLKNTISIKELTDKAKVLVKLTFDIMPNELEHIQLSSAVDECLAACADLLASKAFDCRKEIDPAIVVQVVPAQLQELLANLISNAVRYSPENGVIRITASQCAENVTVSVIDDGIGLAPDHLEQIFDEFFKVDESRHDLDAAGLGLSICKRIIQKHHGRIWAESPGLGHGTSIYFTLNQTVNNVQHG